MFVPLAAINVGPLLLLPFTLSAALAGRTDSVAPVSTRYLELSRESHRKKRASLFLELTDDASFGAPRRFPPSYKILEVDICLLLYQIFCGPSIVHQQRALVSVEVRVSGEFEDERC